MLFYPTEHVLRQAAVANVGLFCASPGVTSPLIVIAGDFVPLLTISTFDVAINATAGQAVVADCPGLFLFVCARDHRVCVISLFYYVAHLRRRWSSVIFVVLNAVLLSVRSPLFALETALSAALTLLPNFFSYRRYRAGRFPAVIEV